MAIHVQPNNGSVPITVLLVGKCYMEVTNSISCCFDNKILELEDLLQINKIYIG